MTIRDIANYCSVSVSTVSRVLNGRPDVSDAVRAKVLAAMDKLNYVPNTSARALGQTFSDSIGVIVRGGGNPFYTQLIQAIEKSVNEAGYTMVINHIPDAGDEVAAGASLARSSRLAGLIFLGGCFDYDDSRMASLNVPYVCCTFANTFGYLSENDYSSVSIDDRKEALRAVRYLTEHGHRRIAILLASKDDNSTGQLRFMGYCDALKEAGIEYDPQLVCETGAYEMDAAYKRTLKLLKSDTHFTALFVIADSLAIAAMKAIYENSLSIPGDISLIAIDGIEMSLYTAPTLTTLVQPREKMGTEAVSTLINIIKNGGENQHLRFAAELREGGTVAALDS